MLNFGSLPHSSPARRRLISVNNNSPLSAKLSWRATASLDSEADVFDVKVTVNQPPKGYEERRGPHAKPKATLSATAGGGGGGAAAAADAIARQPSSVEVEEEADDGWEPHQWVTLTFLDKEAPPLPFRVTPLAVMMKPHTTAQFEVEYDPPKFPEVSKALLVAKLEYQVRVRHLECVCICVACVRCVFVYVCGVCLVCVCMCVWCCVWCCVCCVCACARLCVCLCF